MNPYIEENAWASCTFDMAGSPQQLDKLSDREVVGYESLDRLLTVDDRATKAKFMCKMPAKQWGGLLALVGGIAVGLTLVLSGPVGWVALGAAAAVAIGTTVAVCVHDCSEPLRGGNWTNFKATVVIRGEFAILYNHSQLNCSKGGIIIASESKAAAQALSDQMKWNTRIEVGVQILSNALNGIVVGHGVIDGLDQDWSTIPLAISSYIYLDFAHTEYDPEESLVAGLKFSALGYGLGHVHQLPGMGRLPFTKNLGTEIGIRDLAVTAATAGIGWLADTAESALAKKNEDIINTSHAPPPTSTKTIIGRP